MKKKITALLLSVAAMVSCAFGFSACDEEHTHSYTQKITTEATCTEKGVRTYTCACNDMYTEEIPALGHDKKTHAAQAATCAEKGWNAYETCTRCDYSTYTEIPVLDHPISNEWTYNETHHWHESTCDCNIEADFEQHTLEDSGWCSVCEQAVLPTNGIYYEVSADGTYAEVIAYLGTAKKVNIASTYNDVPVTSIYDNVFKNTAITTVIIPDSITSIGNWAFKNCSSLTEIVIPDSVTSIGNFAFEGCSSLKSVVIGDGVTWICIGAFEGCSSLTSVVIPDSVTSIDDDAFNGCSSLTSVVIPDGVTNIGCAVFSGCSSLTSIAVDVDNKYYKDIDGNLYTKDGKGLIQYAIGKSATAFTISDSVTWICTGAFVGCSSLTKIVIPDSVTNIDSEVFYNCSSLTIYCEAESQPSGWDPSWKSSNLPVVWGYKE